jgi:iron complex transport system substrate-binding protein
MPNSFGADWIIRDLRAALLGDGTVAKAGDVLGRWDAHTAGGSTPTPQPIDQPKPTDVPMPTEAPKPTDLPASTSSSSDAATTTGAAFPVTIEHKFGSTTIARKPERIVCVGLVEQDALLALGIVPVGTTEWFGKYPGAIWPWAQDELAALGSKVPEVVGTAGEESLEKIAALRPDLILGLYSGITPEKYALLEKIAPVVAQPKDLVDYGAPWDTVTRIVGQAVGKAEQADALVKGIEARFEKIRAENPAFAQSTAIASMAWEGVYVYGPQDVRSRLLTSMGFKLPSGLAAVTGDKFGEKLSEEKVELLDNDLVVWIDAQDAKGPLGGPLYAQLNVAKQGREVFLNSSEPLGGATSFISVLSLPYLLDGLLPKITVALDGDPATVAK